MYKVHDRQAAALLALPNSAAGVWLKCGQQSLLAGFDGRLTSSIITMVKATQDDLDALVEAGLFVLDANGYMLPNWKGSQTTEAQRVANAAKVSIRVNKSRTKAGAEKKPAAKPVAKSVVSKVIAPVKIAAPVVEKLATVTVIDAEYNDEIAAENTVAADVVELRPARTRREKPQETLSRFQQSNKDDLDELGRKGRSELLEDLMEYYPRISGNGTVTPAFFKACTNHGIENILEAAEQFGKRSEDTPVSKIFPLQEWLDDEWFLDEAVFANKVDIKV